MQHRMEESLSIMISTIVLICFSVVSSIKPLSVYHIESHTHNIKEYHEQDALCPSFSSQVDHSNLCKMRPCRSHEDCKKIHYGRGFRCCYNGCIKSCLPSESPPIAVDWIEDSKYNSIPLVIKEETEKSNLQKKKLSISGGCMLNDKQYEDLSMFRKHEHVTNCTCHEGEVLCEVTRVKHRLPT